MKHDNALSLSLHWYQFINIDLVFNIILSLQVVTCLILSNSSVSVAANPEDKKHVTIG